MSKKKKQMIKKMRWNDFRLKKKRQTKAQFFTKVKVTASNVNEVVGLQSLTYNRHQDDWILKFNVRQHRQNFVQQRILLQLVNDFLDAP